MAGTVAKFPVSRTVYNNIGEHDASYVNRGTNGVRNMEENVVLDQLQDQSFNKRAEILESLRAQVRRSGGHLPYNDRLSIFKGLSLALSDNNWDVRHKCVQLIHELIPQFGSDLDRCMAVILPKLVPNFGDKITIRRAVIQTMHVYMKHTYNMYNVFRAIIQFGIDSEDPKVRKEVTVALPMLFTHEFSQVDFSDVVQTLAKKLVDATPGENNLQQSALVSLQKIRDLVGEDMFDAYMQKLAAPLRKYFYKLTNRNGQNDHQNYVESRNVSQPSSANSTPAVTPRSSNHHVPSNNDYNDDYGYDSRSYKPASYAPDFTNLEFGVVPSHIMNELEDQENFRKRAQAVEELKSIVKDLKDVGPLLPHVLSFISFLNNLLDDSNFKITTVTLEILALLVSKLNLGVKPHLRHMITVLTKRMGDNKIVVRQAIMKVVMQLMQILSPSPVLTVICENLSHRNSRVRQEAVNIVIASLLTFPSVDFDLADLCMTVAPALVDAKRQVRQAALECFAVLAQAMGAGKLAPLIQAVDSVELSVGGDGVMAAVQARLARRQLPRLNADGLVDYATPTPSSATTRGASNVPQGADTEWILLASGGTGSARSMRSETIELEQVTNSARSTPGGLSHEAPGKGPSPRRFYSAGRGGKSKLPWEDEEQKKPRSNTVENNAGPSNNQTAPLDAPPKPRQTWGEDSPKAIRRASKKPTPATEPPPPPPPPVQSQDTGSTSYKQIHLSKAKRNSDVGKSAPAPAPRKDSLPNEKSEAFSKQPSDKGVPLTHASTPGKKKANYQSEDVDSDVHASWNYYSQLPSKETSKPNKPPFLDPIGSDWLANSNYTDFWNQYYEDPQATAEWPDVDDKKAKVTEESPIPMKPKLARGPSSRKAKVPPIQSEKPSSPQDDDSAYPPSLDSNNHDEFNNIKDMENSLKQIRNSASKKRAEKLNQNSRSPSPDSSDTGFGTSSSYKSTSRKKEKKTDNPFEAKPRIARSQKRLDSDEAQLEFNPMSGVTFRENRNSDVQIIGKGYSDESEPKLITSEPKTNIKSKERRRIQKGPILSPLGMASQHVYGPLDLDDDRIPEPDHIGVVGRGMFDTQNNSSTSDLGLGNFNSGPYDRYKNRRDSSELPSGVYGKGIQEKDLILDRASDEDFEDSDDDISNISMSQTLKDRMAFKKQQKEEEAEQRRIEREKRQREREDKRRKIEEERLREREERRRKIEEQRERDREEKRRLEEEVKQKERERQQQRLRRLSQPEINNDSLLISGNSQPTSMPSSTRSEPGSGKPPAPSPTKRRSGPLVPGSSLASPQSTSRQMSIESDNPDDWKPYPKPENALNDSLRFLQQDDWNIKCNGLNVLRRLIMYHPEVLSNQLHTVILALIAEVKNLRSQVSRLAITTLGEMFLALKRNMDADLDMITKVLLAKSGESNGFIREDVDKALVHMVDSATPQRALLAIVVGGASHRNVAVRKVTALNLCAVVEKMGPGRILSGIKDVTDRVLPTAAQFVTDGSPETRYYGRKIFYMLMTHQDFDKMLSKHIPTGTYRSIQDIIDSLRAKGLGDMPSDTPSARPRRSGQGSRSGSLTRRNSAGSGNDNSPNSAPPSSNSKRPRVRTDDQTMEEIKAMIALMAANDWRERDKGIEQLLEMCENNSNIVGANIIKIFDKFNPRLQDSNSKVNLNALHIMLQITPLLRDYLGVVINMTIQNVAPNLSSKNKEIYNTAMEILDTFMEHLDGSLLLQPFANQAQCGNARVKPDMIEKVAYLVTKVYPRKQKQVILHVLPLLWHLLGLTTAGSGAGSSGNIRTATNKLVSSLYLQMGQGLIETASTNTNVTPRALQLLQDIIDSL
ncbi:TOG array regulator of axonemal microtubules protein 1-like isoform X2 [Lineus longissimus]|uniref:TOG array regulator of axonemal microtubules protein 1-like isoform X2 n=1 Tax=Lineus longissimus TaxID=88925 RepID=UPI00315CF08A